MKTPVYSTKMVGFIGVFLFLVSWKPFEKYGSGLRRGLSILCEKL